MDWLILMWIMGFVLLVFISYIGYKEYKKQKQKTYPDLIGVIICIIAICIILICCLGAHIWAYSDAVDLPYKYRAAIKNIEEMEEYLMRYETLSNESLGNIGQGLESLEYKQQIQIAIKNKNEIYANICSWLNNWWSPYKDVVISGLPPGDYGTVTI